MTRVFEPVDLEDEPLFDLRSGDFLDPVDLEGEKIPKPSEYLSSEQKMENRLEQIKSSKKRGCG